MVGFQILLITVSLLPKHFWRYVVWRSTQGLLAFTIVINLKARIVIAAISYVLLKSYHRMLIESPYLGCKTKISNLDLHAVVEEDIAELQIP